jgi:amidohydrolase
VLKLIFAVLLFTAAAPAAADDRLLQAFAKEQADLLGFYKKLHAAPELSLKEAATAATLAAELKRLGFEVTTGVGGHGIVGVLRNNAGPTVLLRTDMDALPVEEKTGLPYASRVRAPDAAGRMVSVMHACGHDMHMTAWAGAARLLAGARDRWAGTLVMIGQPAEEIGQGAERMLADGLYKRFPRPDHALALHVSAELAAGHVGYVPEYTFAGIDGVDITVHGRGGHGAYPHKTVDPIVIASRIVVALQTLVARENDPLDPAVVTVGTFQGGTRRNVIPDEVKLELTVRWYKPEVRKRLLDGITRVAEAEAAAAGAPRKPRVEVRKDEHLEPVFNDPALTTRVAAALGKALGADRVRRVAPVMGGEDFGEYGRAGVPSFMFWLGVVEPRKAAEAQKGTATLPSLHSPLFAPDAAPALRAGVVALAAGALEIFSGRIPPRRSSP